MAPMATAADLAAMAGNPVVACSRSCDSSDWSSDNVVSVIGGQLVAVGSRVGHFVPQGTNTPLTLSTVPVLRSLGNTAIAGLRVFSGNAFFVLSDGSQQPVAGVLYSKSSNSIYFYDGIGKTFVYNNGQITELNYNQLLWLYSWSSGRVCFLAISGVARHGHGYHVRSTLQFRSPKFYILRKFGTLQYVADPITGIRWWRGMEVYFDPTRRSIWWATTSIPAVVCNLFAAVLSMCKVTVAYMFGALKICTFFCSTVWEASGSSDLPRCTGWEAITSSTATPAFGGARCLAQRRFAVPSRARGLRCGRQRQPTPRQLTRHVVGAFHGRCSTPCITMGRTSLHRYVGHGNVPMSLRP